MTEIRSLTQIVREHLDTCPVGMPLDPRGTFLSGALAGEAGELANEFKKQWRGAMLFAPETRRDKILGELADVGCYALMLAEHLGVNLLDIARAKLLAFEGRPEWGYLQRAGTSDDRGRPPQAEARELTSAEIHVDAANAAWRTAGGTPAEVIAETIGCTLEQAYAEPWPSQRLARNLHLVVRHAW